jgi:hypothetical protein
MRPTAARALILAVSGGVAVACTLVTDLSGLTGGTVAESDSSVEAAPPFDGGADSVSPGDGGTEAAPRACDAEAPFGAPSLLTGVDVNTGASARSVTLTADELTLCFDGLRDGGKGGEDVWCAARSSPGAAFGTPVNVGGVNTGSDQFGPSFAPDRLTLYFSHDGSNFDIWAATRGNPQAMFGTAGPVAGWTSSAADVNPYAAGSNVYFISDRMGDLDIYVGKPGLAPARIDEIRTGGEEHTPVVTPDELHIYFNRGGVTGNILVAHRASTAQEWGMPKLLAELNSGMGDWPAWVSPNACRLYFGSRRTGGIGGTSIWVAEKTP